jgi:receptor protein-tyrosine kinase
VLAQASNRTAEDYRQLRTNLQFVDVDEPPKVIMMASAVPSEGKTTAAINLALALADSGKRVTVLEADLRRPRLTKYLALVEGVGLTNVLAGTATIDDVVQPYLETGLQVIGAGPTPPNPGKVLASSQMATLIDKLRGSNDFVIIDAPPLLPVADSTALATFVDGVLLSVRYGITKKEQLRHAAANLALVRAQLLGLILNIIPATTEVASVYGYGYGYEDPLRGRHAPGRGTRGDAGRGTGVDALLDQTGDDAGRPVSDSSPDADPGKEPGS